VRRLVGSLKNMGSWSDDWQVPTASAITQARQRLEPVPLRELFDRAAMPVAGPGTNGAWLAGCRVMAIDGSSFDMAAVKPPRLSARARGWVGFGRACGRGASRTGRRRGGVPGR
jgi:hypothetical protein